MSVKAILQGQKTDISSKQDKLIFDDTPLNLSDHPVKSSGIKAYVDNSIQESILDSWEASY